MGNSFLEHFRTLSTKHCLNATAYLSIVADPVHHFMITVNPSCTVKPDKLRILKISEETYCLKMFE